MTAQNAELLKPQDVAGDVGTSGVVPKAWVRRNGNFCLLKDGDIRDVNAELLASKIIDCFDVSHVSYHMEEYEGTPVSCCEIITDETHSIVPFEHYKTWCVNQGKDAKDFIRKLDCYGYGMMNVVDYLIGNTDRHWGNWGLLVDNTTNQPISLHPLMDFNKAFLSYETTEGSICQTADGKISQKQAAINAVREIGLNQIRTIDESWFDDVSIKEMFFQRLSILKNESNN